jgi:hypothetical protein
MDLPLLRIKKPENTEAERQRLEQKRNENLKAKQSKYAKRREELREGKKILFNNDNNSNSNGNENVWEVSNEAYLFNEPPFTPQNSYIVKRMPMTPRKPNHSTRFQPSSFSKRRLSYSNNRQKRAKTNSKGGKRKTYRRRR